MSSVTKPFPCLPSGATHFMWKVRREKEAEFLPSEVKSLCYEFILDQLQDELGNKCPKGHITSMSKFQCIRQLKIEHPPGPMELGLANTSLLHRSGQFVIILCFPPIPTPMA
jgi:hypothetical protein